MVQNEKIVLPVPRFSQKFEPGKWQIDGFQSQPESVYWSERSCGLACVEMCVAYFTKTKIPLARLLREGLQLQAHISKGWVHKGLADLAGKHGIAGQPITISENLDEIISAIRAGDPVIASVAKEFPKNGRKGGHLVVVTGFELINGQVAKVYLNDPSDWGGSNNCVSLKRFLASFSGRGIVMSSG